MSYRIIIEDQKGLHQAILNETEEAKEVIHNINNILKMSDLTDYIYMFDLKNTDGCDISIHGNAEKLAKMYDLLTHFLMQKDPGIIVRVLAAWDKRRGAANDNN
ncbi:MAG: hypothetical protein J6R32_03345 [Bacteroidales bacterium]|nr:hypothetical protein [Bacteroidales bacterium]